MDDKYLILAAQLGEDRLKRDVELDQYFSGNPPGQADCLYIATSERELVHSVELAQELEIFYKVLGTGSKTDFSKEFFAGLIIKNRYDTMKIFGIKGKVSRQGIGVEEALVEAGSGASLEKLADFAQKQNLTGLEVLEDLPGTVGGSLLTNTVLGNFFCQARILLDGGETETVDFLPSERNNVIVSVVFKLKAKR